MRAKHKARSVYTRETGELAMHMHIKKRHIYSCGWSHMPGGSKRIPFQLGYRICGIGTWACTISKFACCYCYWLLRTADALVRSQGPTPAKGRRRGGEGGGGLGFRAAPDPAWWCAAHDVRAAPDPAHPYADPVATGWHLCFRARTTAVQTGTKVHKSDVPTYLPFFVMLGDVNV
jgi:hypothetical protein